jgi:hypothetical protein
MYLEGNKAVLEHFLEGTERKTRPNLYIRLKTSEEDFELKN